MGSPNPRSFRRGGLGGTPTWSGVDWNDNTFDISSTGSLSAGTITLGSLGNTALYRNAAEVLRNDTLKIG